MEGVRFRFGLTTTLRRCSQNIQLWVDPGRRSWIQIRLDNYIAEVLPKYSIVGWSRKKELNSDSAWQLHCGGTAEYSIVGWSMKEELDSDSAWQLHCGSAAEIFNCGLIQEGGVWFRFGLTTTLRKHCRNIQRSGHNCTRWVMATGNGLAAI